MKAKTAIARDGIEIAMLEMGTPLFYELPDHGKKRILAGVSRDEYAVEVRAFLVEKLAEYGIRYTQDALNENVQFAVRAAFATYGDTVRRAA